jgi:two-component system, OmpR family, sensor histidine kinase PrrB
VRAPRSLRGRVTAAAVAAVALAGLPSALVLLAAIERDGRRAVDSELAQRIQEIARRPPDHDHDGFGHGPEGLLVGSGTFAQVSFGGRVVDRQGDVPSEPPAMPASDGLSTVTIDGESWRALTQTLGDERVEVAQTLTPVRDRVATTRRLVAAIGVLALALTGLAAWLFASLTLRPLARLRAGAARVSGADDLRTPLPADDGPDEVRSLARTLNDMLARLQAAMEATRRFAADAGHELRTPLTGMRANLDALARNPGLDAAQRAALVRETTGELERAVHVLEGLQALARGEAAESLPREDVELDDLLDAAVYAARRRHPGVRYELEEPLAGGPVRGWGEGLRLLVDNLLDNAALHGRPGGEVHVALARDNGHVVLRVEDDGPGVPAGDRARVLEPFARAAAAGAPGTGLGLTIVVQQAALHGGAVRLAESRLGGLAVEARLAAS